MRGLKGKVAVVTGGGSGIGEAAARRLAEEGCAVAVVDRNGETAGYVAESLRRTGATSYPIPTDVGSEAQVEAAYDAAIRQFGRVDIVVSNAGHFDAAHDCKVENLELAVWEDTNRVNFTGMFLTCKHGVRAIKATAKKGAIVLTGSPTGMFGCAPTLTAYSSSKGGVHALTRIMAADYALDDIRVNSVLPGFTLTPIVSKVTSDPAVMEAVMRTIPMRRGARPEEIAAAIAFIASDDASYMTGSLVVVDGGQTAI
jgi:NAD(P)-dependent dehydrogenase (short-subunit alcohol dehydrogenase family)